MANPIHADVGIVFVPVSDMDRAIDFYTRLFDLPPGGTGHEGRIHDLPMQDGVRLLLDGHAPVANSSQPLAAFRSDDVHAARERVRELAAPIERDVEDIGSMLTLAFRDPDGNLLMVCERKPT